MTGDATGADVVGREVVVGDTVGEFIEEVVVEDAVDNGEFGEPPAMIAPAILPPATMIAPMIGLTMPGLLYHGRRGPEDFGDLS